MLLKKILDLRKFAGLPDYIVFSDDDNVLRPYSSWDLINNSKRNVAIDMYRRHDVIFNSSQVRDRFYYAAKETGCIRNHTSIMTAASGIIHIVDVVEPDKFAACCKYAPLTEVDYLLVIHEVAGTYQILSGLGSEMYGYLTEALTYDRR